MSTCASGKFQCTSIIACSDYNVNMFIATMLNTILIYYPIQDGMCYFGPVVIDVNVR